MLTRKSAALDDDGSSWTDDYDVTEDEFWAMSEAEQKELEARFEADMDRHDEEHKRRYKSYTLEQQYKFDRRMLLQAILRTRTRIEDYTTGKFAEFNLDFIAIENRALLKKFQHQLIDIRLRRRTGINGGSA